MRQNKFESSLSVLKNAFYGGKESYRTSTMPHLKENIRKIVVEVDRLDRKER